MGIENGRGAKALIGTASGILREIVSLICGLILPRLILSAFGSTYNGLITSITQFISVIALMQAGIGGVAKAALYKPLAEKDFPSISKIVNQTQRYLRKVLYLFFAFTIVFAGVYSFFFVSDFDFWFTFSLIFIIAMSTFAQYYFGLSRQMLLNADQKQYFTSNINMIATILNTVVLVLLIAVFNVRSIHIVKLASSFVFTLPPIVFYFYTQKRYFINKKFNSKEDVLPQKWDALGHEVANFINMNTDIIVLTVFTDLKTVSVYSVYQYVVYSIRNVLTNFVTGFEAAFGNMYAKNQYELMERNFKLFELIVFSFVSVIYSAVFVLLTPFVKIYTLGITDTDYNRVLFGIILTAALLISCTKIPYETVTKAVGHYRQTMKASIIEAIINISVSVICVFKFGLVGVAIGTLVAMLFRSIVYAVYLSKNVIKRSIFLYVKHMLLLFIIAAITYALSYLYLKDTTNIFTWILYALITVAISTTLTLILDLVFYKKDLILLLSKIKLLIKKRKKVK